MNARQDSDQIAELYQILRHASDHLTAEGEQIRLAFAQLNIRFLEVAVALNGPQLDDLRERLDSSSRDFLEMSDRLATDLDDALSYLRHLSEMTAEMSASFTMAGVAVAAATIGPFVTAFCTELGKRFGGSVADWAARMKLRSGGGDPARPDLFVEVDGAVIVIELDKSLPDEARLALLDLDIESSAIRGHRLMWDGEAQAWVPTKLET
jgi:hypothetical protein